MIWLPTGEDYLQMSSGSSHGGCADGRVCTRELREWRGPRTPSPAGAESPKASHPGAADDGHGRARRNGESVLRVL
ncbi:MAG: hypothetical protein R6U70_02865 [Bacillota bacterium]